jgi:hypothetical protein
MYGGTMGSLKIYDNGVEKLVLAGDKGNKWYKQQVDLSSDRNVSKCMGINVKEYYLN